MAVTPIYGFTLPTVAGDSGVWGGFLNTDITALENEIARSRVPFLTPTYNVGGTTTIDCSQTTGARVHLLTVSGASTLAFSNVPSSSFAVAVYLKITNGGAFALSFPGAVTWLPGSAPVFKASGVDWAILWTTDGGTTWSGMHPVGVLFQDVDKTTASAVEASLTSFTVPAAALSANGHALRVTLYGASTTGTTAQILIKFGATNVLSDAGIANGDFVATALITRTGAATQRAYGYTLRGTTVIQAPGQSAPTETLANAIVLDIRGLTASGVLTVRSVQLEYLGAR